MKEYDSETTITTRLRLIKFVEAWEAAGYTDNDDLIEPWAEQPVDENGDGFGLKLKDIKVLLQQ